MRRLLVVGGVIGLTVFSWNKYITNWGLVKVYDDNPNRPGAAPALYYMARTYQLFGHPKKGLDLYQRVVDRYLESDYGMEAMYSVGMCYETLKDYRNAYISYAKFLEKFPQTKYTTSVVNNLNFLRDRGAHR